MRKFGRQVAFATKLCTVAPNVCGSFAWNLRHVTVLAPRMLTRILNVWKISESGSYSTVYFRLLVLRWKVGIPWISNWC